MGGRGSGNWYRYDSKPTEENFWRFSTAALKEHGVLRAEKWGSGNWKWLRNGEVRCSISYEVNTLQHPAWLRVQYSNKDSGKAYDYKINLTTTRPHYGGRRWWFLCPVQGCDKRVSVLYLAHIFACRRCCNFTYSSQNEAPHDRLLSKAQSLHQQMGGDGVVMDGAPLKPKGMHWKTYWRKVKAMEAMYHGCMMEAAQRLGIKL